MANVNVTLTGRQLAISSGTPTATGGAHAVPSGNALSLVTGATGETVTVVQVTPHSVSGNVGVAGATIAWASVDALQLENGSHILLENGTGKLLEEVATSGVVTADASGNFIISGLANDSYVVIPSAAGSTFTPASQTVPLTDAGVGGVNFSAGVSYSISGNVGVAGATVAYTGAASGSVVSATDGSYTIVGLQNGGYTITPSLSGYSFGPSSQSETLAGVNITGVNFTAISNTYSISGNVGVTGVTVVYTGAASGSIVSDGGGNFTIPGLPNGSYMLTPSLNGYVFSPTTLAVTVNAGNVTGVNFLESLQASYGIAGNCGVAGATIYWSGTSSGSTTADANGNFSIASLTNGSYTLTPSMTGYVFAPKAQTVFIVNASVIGVTFTTSPMPPYSIIGNCGVAGATVYYSGAAAGSVVADENGGFVITGLFGGIYTLTPSLTGYVFDPVSMTVVVSGADVQGIFFDGTATATFSISGNVGVAGATVSYLGSPGGSVVADANGNYTITGLTSKAWTITPTKAGYSFSPSSQQKTIQNANVTGINHTAAPLQTYSISGSCGAPGAYITYMGPNANGVVTADANGNYVISGLPAGSYMLTPQKAGFKFTPAYQVANVIGGNVTFLLQAPISGSQLQVSYLSMIQSKANVTIKAGIGQLGVLTAGTLQWLSNPILYRYEDLSFGGSPTDPALTFVYENTTKSRAIQLYVYYYNLLDELSKCNPTGYQSSLPIPSVSNLFVNEADGKLEWVGSAASSYLVEIATSGGLSGTSLTGIITSKTVTDQFFPLDLQTMLSLRYYRVTPIDALGNGTPVVISHQHIPQGVEEFIVGTEITYVPQMQSATQDPTAIPVAFTPYQDQIKARSRMIRARLTGSGYMDL